MTTIVPEPPRDFLGREIKIGDKVVYATVAQVADFTEGVVIDLPVKFVSKSNYSGYNYSTISEPEFHIKVRVVSSRWDRTLRRYAESYYTKTLADPSRFLVITDLPDYRK